MCGRLRAKDADLSACEKKLLSAESQVNELQARLNDAVNQRRHFEDEYNVSSLTYTLCHSHRTTLAVVVLICVSIS